MVGIRNEDRIMALEIEIDLLSLIKAQEHSFLLWNGTNREDPEYLSGESGRRIPEFNAPEIRFILGIPN